MEENTYHRLADACLQQIMERIEQQDERGEIDCEPAAGVLTIELPSGKQFVVSKHAPSRQVWLSSPLSGGLHFKWDESKGYWTAGEQELYGLLADELSRLSGISMRL